ncbi:hypothetical protein FPY71_04280 [Aureimonas fodinaquatilis]|uniref:Uncharacterized protein n=1 Tax=Aureimonas fodinaquatilis TaxID=2565783 RepID=A0A5B0E1Z8_9HYPH|nr:hypothetical protein [Aureimonas fodinaquatilis]KAA0972322.1 hypothetical protein FPY71_04280 [Aureimonas fodinaquatilis]
MTVTEVKGEGFVVALDEEVQPQEAMPEVDAAEIEALLSDETMPVDEKHARLHVWAKALGERDDTDLNPYPDGLLEQINEALALLAEGGHTYNAGDGEADR